MVVGEAVGELVGVAKGIAVNVATAVVLNKRDSEVGVIIIEDSTSGVAVTGSTRRGDFTSRQADSRITHTTDKHQ